MQRNQFATRLIQKILISVCVEIEVTTSVEPHLLDWKLGPCFKSREHTNDKVYNQKGCCIEPGNYTLTCYNTQSPDGWKKGKITINGNDYCDDFIGYKAMRRITIMGTFIYVSIYGIPA